MSVTATAAVPTAHGSRYLQQLCKHWSHNLAVEFDATHGRVVFPRDMRGSDWPSDGEARFSATDDTLDVMVDASGEAHLTLLQAVIASHLDRFAFREAPLPLDWKPAAT